MKIKNPLLHIALILIAFSAIIGWTLAPAVSAHPDVCPPGSPRNAGQHIPHTSARQAEAFCTGETSAEEQNVAAGNIPTDCDETNLTSGNCKIVYYIALLTKALSITVGAVIVTMIAWGGVQYTSAHDNPQQAASAKDHIRNAILALIFYIFSVAFLNYLIPGGIF